MVLTDIGNTYVFYIIITSFIHKHVVLQDANYYLLHFGYGQLFRTTRPAVAFARSFILQLYLPVTDDNFVRIYKSSRPEFPVCMEKLVFAQGNSEIRVTGVFLKSAHTKSEFTIITFEQSWIGAGS
jgi:hypothetical protein